MLAARGTHVLWSLLLYYAAVTQGRSDARSLLSICPNGLNKSSIRGTLYLRVKRLERFPRAINRPMGSQDLVKHNKQAPVI